MWALGFTHWRWKVNTKFQVALVLEDKLTHCSSGPSTNVNASVCTLSLCGRGGTNSSHKVLFLSGLILISSKMKSDGTQESNQLFP